MSMRFQVFANLSTSVHYVQINAFDIGFYCYLLFYCCLDRVDETINNIIVSVKCYIVQV